MKKLFTLLLFLFFSCSANAASMLYEAVCIVPVADMIGQPMATYGLSEGIREAYANLPFSWGRSAQDRDACPRIHQLLLHERVEVLEERGEELLVAIPQVYHLQGKEKRNEFWILRDQLAPLSEIYAHNDSLSFLPSAISHGAKNIENVNYEIITFLSPYYCSELAETFSAGMRCVIAAEDEQCYKVWILNATTLTPFLVSIAKDQVIKGYLENPADRQRLFVNLLKSWACESAFIPYVFGGCSFQHKIEHNAFEERTLKTMAGKILSYWHRVITTSAPLSGFDCSGMIVRAAQIVSLPLYAKNTTTLLKTLRELGDDEIVEEGDLLLYKGHVMVVSDCKNFRIIESRGYSAGFGKVHELPLDGVFEGIKTFDELHATIREKKMLRLLNNTGECTQEVSDLKILKMSSCYKSL